MNGNALETAANNSLNNPLTYFLGFVTGEPFPTDESAELFNKAGNGYVLENNYKCAIRCFYKAYTLYLKSDIYKYNAFKNLELVIKYGRQSNTYSLPELVKMLETCALYYGVDGKIKQYNDKYIEISKLYEECDMLQDACDVLTKCKDEDNMASDDILKRKAELLIARKRYIHAGECYEIISNKMLAREKTKMLSMFARPLQLLSILCALASNDIVQAKNRLEFFSNDCCFLTTYEGILATNIITSFEENDIDNFSRACESYDNIKKLSKIHVELLTQTKLFLTGSLIANDGDDEDMT